jgi:hypothetical protein
MYVRGGTGIVRLLHCDLQDLMCYCSMQFQDISLNMVERFIIVILQFQVIIVTNY